jgi:hypothetical protein
MVGGAFDASGNNIGKLINHYGTTPPANEALNNYVGDIVDKYSNTDEPTSFISEITKARAETGSDREEDFAQAEIDLFFNNNVSLPLSYRAVPKSFVFSYIDVETQSTSAENTVFFTLKQSPKLRTFQESTKQDLFRKYGMFICDELHDDEESVFNTYMDDE